MPRGRPRGRPRIRSTHPETWSSEHFLTLSLAGRECWRWLTSMCDDEGLVKATPTSLRMNACPNVIVDLGEIEEQWSLMIDQRMILPYEFGIDRYVWVVNFRHWNIIDRPTDTILPRPPRGLVENFVAPLSLHEEVRELLDVWGVANYSTNNREFSMQDRDRDRDISYGDTSMSSSGATPNPTPAPILSPPPVAEEPLLVEDPFEADVLDVFAAWKAAAKSKAELSGERRKAIEGALSGRKGAKAHRPYSKAVVLRAAVGWRHFAHNRGDTGAKFNDLTLVLRDAEHIDRFAEAEERYERGELPEPPAPWGNGTKIVPIAAQAGAGVGGAWAQGAQRRAGLAAELAARRAGQ